MKNRAIIVLFVLCIGIYSIHGDLEVKRIVHSEFCPIVPSIYGDKIVWVSLTEDTYGLETSIYLYDISKDEKRKICNNCCCSEAVIYGDKIVWADHGMSESDRRIGSNSHIYLYDLSKGKKIRITETLGGSPKIYKDRIVYIGEKDILTDPEIYLYDLSSGEEKKLIPCPGIVNMDFHGDKIVWEREMGAVNIFHHNHDIFLYDLSTGQQKRITDDPIEQYSPKIYGDKIIWGEIEYKGFAKQSEYRLCLYDLSTNEKKIIDTGPGGSDAIYKDKIMWCGHRNGKSGIFLYNISTGEEKVVVYDYWGVLAMYENTVVWAGSNGASYIDMYFCNIDEASLLPPTTLPPTTSPATTSSPMTTSPPTTLPQTKSSPITSSQNSSYSLYLGILGGILIFLVIAIPLLTLSKRKSEKMKDIKKETQKEDLMTLLSKKYLDGKITKEQYLKFKKKIEKM